MSFDLKTTHQTQLEPATPDKKLNRLIDEIEQQKLLLAAWQNAKDEIRTYSQKALMPAYRDLYATLYEQMQTLWNSLNLYHFSKTDTATVEDKIQALSRLLQGSRMLNQQQVDDVEKMYAYYVQANEYDKKKSKKKNVESFDEPENKDSRVEDENFDEDWNNDQYQQVREQAKLKRQQEKQAQAEKMVNQSLKTVYLKIASIIHPDREPDEAKKEEKTELLQRANEAYEQED